MASSSHRGPEHVLCSTSLHFPVRYRPRPAPTCGPSVLLSPSHVPVTYRPRALPHSHASSLASSFERPHSPPGEDTSSSRSSSSLPSSTSSSSSSLPPPVPKTVVRKARRNAARQACAPKEAEATEVLHPNHARATQEGRTEEEGPDGDHLPLASRPKRRVPAPEEEDELVTLEEAQRVYRRARELFELSPQQHSDGASSLSARDREEQQIISFWRRHVTSRTAGALYISGSPGTGKTLTVQRVLSSMKAWERAEKKRNAGFNRSLVVELNGMQIKGEHIEDQLLKALEQSPGKRLEECLACRTNSRMTVVLLDELDQLIMQKQTAILYRLFEITTLPRSSLIFIGVANALQLRESLPQLKTAKYDAKVEELTFESYTKSQLLDILRVRQDQVGRALFDEAAIQLCAAQAAKSSGDARKALHMAKLAIENLLKEMPLHWDSNVRKRLPLITAHAMIQTSHAILGEGNKRSELILSLPFHQQLALFSLVVAKRCGKDASGTALSLDKVFETYKALCVREGLSSVSSSEFNDMCSALVGHALISKSKGKGHTSPMLILQATESDMQLAALRVKQLQRILSSHA